jgi:2-dehydropantoate 2-reductase
MKLNIAILGAGSLGCAMGGVLAEGGHQVTLINRHAAFVDAINQHGLILNAAGIERTVAVRAVTQCSEVDLSAGELDVLLVLVKSFHTEAAMQAALPLVGKSTAVLSLQNGVGHEAILSRMVGAHKVLAGKTYVGGVVLGPGRVIDGSRGKETIIGELDGSMSERAQRIATAFTAAGLVTHVSPNIMTTIWDKLLVNAATGALSAITGLPYGPLYEQGGLEATAIALVAEGMAVAKASGIAISFTDPREPWVKAGAGLPREFKPSMLQSLDKGSITEIDFINGAIVEQGARLGVPTPVNATLVACVKALESKLQKVNSF